jgi:alcohol dehydrogenase class IV
MTPINGLTEDDLKKYGTRPACVAEDAYPRPGLSRELPPDLYFVSGLDATAHAAEGAVCP